MKIAKIYTLILLSLVSRFAAAYDVVPNNILVRPQLGANINVVRSDSAQLGSPSALMITGAEVEYIFHRNFGAIGGLRPAFSAGFVELETSLGAKYRLLDIDLPFVLYVSMSMTAAFLFPVRPDANHFNLGLRPALGADYFVMRNLAVGLELNLKPSVMFASGKTQFEFGVGFLIGMMWRI